MGAAFRRACCACLRSLLPSHLGAETMQSRSSPARCFPLDHHLSRRAFLGSTAGLLAGSVVGLDCLGSPVLAEQLQKDQKRAILIFLSGGASQFETWDPKPGRPTGGPFQAIQTSVPGVRIGELMPAMAQRLHKHTAVIRSLSCKNVEH